MKNSNETPEPREDDHADRAFWKMDRDTMDFANLEFAS